MLYAVRCMLYAVSVPVVVMMQLTRYKNPLEGLASINRFPLVPLVLLVPLMPTTESILGASDTTYRLPYYTFKVGLN